MSGDRMTEDEQKLMVSLLSKYVETEMDQHEHLKFKSRVGNVYVTLSYYPDGDDSAYTDVTNTINTEHRYDT